MKKFLSMILALTMAFSLAACGKKTDNASAVEGYVSAFVASDDFADTVERAKETGINFEIEARGDDLVYKLSFTVDIPKESIALVKQSIEEGAEALDSTAELFRKDAPEVDKVIWEYYTNDGTLIASIEK